MNATTDRHSSGDSIRILYVDDQPEMTELVATFLERTDERLLVETATDVETGLAMVADDDIECIVSDYDMPGMTGIDFLTTIRDRDTETPFILFTGKGSEEIASEAISAGVTDYLQKGSGTERYALLAKRIENAVTKYRAERAVETTHHRYQRLIEETSDVIASVDQAGTLEYLSVSIERLLGYQPDELTGENAFEYIHPADRARAKDAFGRIIADPECRPTIEFRFAHQDGSWIWLEGRGRNLLDDPAIEGVVIYSRDITDRKTQQAELQETTWLLEGVIETIDVAVWVRDTDGRYLLMNESCRDLLGIDTTAAVTEIPADELHSNVSLDWLETEEQRVIETERSLEPDGSIERPSNADLTRIRLSPLLDCEGDVFAVCGIASTGPDPSSSSD